MYTYMHIICVKLSVCVCVYTVVCHCLATKVFYKLIPGYEMDVTDREVYRSKKRTH